MGAGLSCAILVILSLTRFDGFIRSFCFYFFLTFSCYHHVKKCLSPPVILRTPQPGGTRKESQVNQKEQKLEICRHTCGWCYSTTCTSCGLPQHVEKYNAMAHTCNPNIFGDQGRRITGTQVLRPTWQKPHFSKKNRNLLHVVAHICVPNYSGGLGGRIT
ncbi:uncharacterized protein LOC116563387 [Sapajus apella]|uniref:Uncharacterized protein LOC116563387 n=1 Tax=Sapajus apella TaxID=9515 RepID=A0A6J3JBW7_SAPAP|nr:uncharacterized protein LOC116563387 [Sapajus apella]